MRYAGIFLGSVAGVSIALNTVYAQAIIGTPTSIMDIDTIVSKVWNLTNWFFTFLLVLSIGVMVFAGFILLSSAGDPSKVDSGKKFLLWALVGFAVILLSKGILILVCNWLVTGGCPTSYFP